MPELPMKIIVIVVIVVLVLVILSTFLLGQAGSQISKADAERIFASQCQVYSQNNCEWAVTRNSDFNKYVEACRVLYGPERDSFSCLYVLCNACKDTQNSQIKCAGICNACKGNDETGINTEPCCAEFTAQCTGVLDCEVCKTG
ncbi:MAG: hypothetical protein HY513_02400 [Candidatus Aenigmarchaeota archaeon]|nr:hypothetical protein [Candidatus Aenigmarchaeota archaeon]